MMWSQPDKHDVGEVSDVVRRMTSWPRSSQTVNLFEMLVGNKVLFLRLDGLRERRFTGRPVLCPQFLGTIGDVDLRGKVLRAP